MTGSWSRADGRSRSGLPLYGNPHVLDAPRLPAVSGAGYATFSPAGERLRAPV